LSPILFPLFFLPSPESIVKIAWAISGKYTDGVEGKDTAQSWNEIKDQLTSNKNLMANLQYANDLNASFLVSNRIFALIVRHRDLLFNVIEERKTNELFLLIRHILFYPRNQH
jgi:hypothetical protein